MSEPQPELLDQLWPSVPGPPKLKTVVADAVERIRANRLMTRNSVNRGWTVGVADMRQPNADRNTRGAQEGSVPDAVSGAPCGTQEGQAVREVENEAADTPDELCPERTRRYDLCGQGKVEFERYLEWIEFLRNRGNDPKLSLEERARARVVVKFCEREREATRFRDRLAWAEISGIQEEATQLGALEIAEVIADMVVAIGVPTSKLYDAIEADIRCRSPRWLPEQFIDSLAVRWFGVISVALITESGRRSDQTEDDNGGKIRELLVEEDERGERLQQLAEQISKGLWLSPYSDGVDWSAEGADEARSLAQEKIWEKLYELASVDPVASDPSFHLALMQGSFNTILAHVRYHIRTQVETQERRSTFFEFSQLDPDETLGTKTAEQGARGDVEGNLYRKLLVEQICQEAAISEEDRLLVELVKRDGYSQNEAIRELGLTISQSEASKRIAEALKKMAEAVGQELPSICLGGV